MKAAVVTEFSKPLVIEERPIPQPRAHQILVRMEACGLCHTDIHAAHGDWPVRPTAPFVPGHEGIGIVEAVGPLVERLHEGDRVAIPWLGQACGYCRYCVTGREPLCLAQRNSGYSVDGAFAEYALAHGDYAVKVPAALDPLDAAPLTCAGVTSYKAVKISGARSGKRALVSGIGGLGHLALQYTRITGAETIAVDVTDDKLQLAKDLGADHVVDARTQDVARTVRALGGADVAIGLAASNSSLQAAYESLNRGGTLVCVALPADGRLSIPVFEHVLESKNVIGSIVGTRQDLREVFRMHELGRTRVIREERPLDRVNESIDEVLTGRAAARLVFTFPSPAASP